MQNTGKNRKNLELDELKDLDFKTIHALKEAILRAEELKDYPWDECIKDQMKRYGSKEIAEKVCGYIKAKYGG